MRELDEVLGPHLDVGARVEQQERRAGHRDDDRQRRAVDAAGALEAEQRGGQRGAGRAAGDERVGAPEATASTACTIEDSGVARTARAGSGALAIETGASTTSTSAAVPISAAGPNRITRTPLAASGGAPRHLGGAEVGPVGVDRDG